MRMPITFTTWIGTLILLAVALPVGFWMWEEKRSFVIVEEPQISYESLMYIRDLRKRIREEAAKETEREAKKEVFIPPPLPSLERMKTQGCVFDGMLSRYGDEEEMVKMAARSECYYFHRAVETWLEAPDFGKAKKLKDAIGKDSAVFGMFIAEALKTDEDYYWPQKERKFDFDEMCRSETMNKWGEHTCIPTLRNKEYRNYIRVITQQAMDIGIQSFMFGQVFYQDSVDDSKMQNMIWEMKEYAYSRGMKIVVGAQTNDITDEKYLAQFDYIEGGVGITSNGSIPSGPCHTRWWKRSGDWCWALLWHDRYRTKANNVFIHLDWSGVAGDDMSRFARMDRAQRADTIRRLHAYFTDRDIGFLVPFFTALPTDNNGCYGERERYYSADNQYSCKDEDMLNSVLKKAEMTMF